MFMFHPSGMRNKRAVAMTRLEPAAQSRDRRDILPISAILGPDAPSGARLSASGADQNGNCA
jgi:hypothetical protein